MKSFLLEMKGLLSLSWPIASPRFSGGAGLGQGSLNDIEHFLFSKGFGDQVNGSG
jgi:hypothetical protein